LLELFDLYNPTKWLLLKVGIGYGRAGLNMEKIGRILLKVGMGRKMQVYFSISWEKPF
jgi:hypothetical protein